MAKGVEDTALYRFHRLVSLNEVGGEPDVFGISVHRFHADSRYRARFWPHEMLTTSTHDTKRCEDVRARIGVLSEAPGEWRAMLLRWRRMNRQHKHEIDGRLAPGPNQEYLLYQTLLGTLPTQPMDDAARKQYSQRIGDYMVKASREAKTRTSWSDIGEQYESALQTFVERILDPADANPFPADLYSEVRRLSRFGFLNSLSQVLCKLTAPGVPDIYQGNEIWDDSLVDPDNRRPVDYDRRRQMLAQLQSDAGEAADRTTWTRSLLDHIDDGRAKLFITHHALQLRRRWPELFSQGAYVPLRVTGRYAAHICAFARRHQDRWVIVAVPRLCVRLRGSSDWPPLGDEVWLDTRIVLPRRVRRSLTNLFDGKEVTVAEEGMRRFVDVGALFSALPLVLLQG